MKRNQYEGVEERPSEKRMQNIMSDAARVIGEKDAEIKALQDKIGLMKSPDGMMVFRDVQRDAKMKEEKLLLLLAKADEYRIDLEKAKSIAVSDRELITRLQRNLLEVREELRIEKEDNRKKIESLEEEIRKLKKVNQEQGKELKEIMDEQKLSHFVARPEGVATQSPTEEESEVEVMSKKECPFPNCGFLFGSQGAMSRHINSHHFEERAPEG